MTYTQKSVTGRTSVETSVGERGDVAVKIYRNGQCVNEFSLPMEKDLGTHAELRKVDGVVEIWHDGPMGVKKLVGRWRDGKDVTGEPALIPSSTGQGLREE